MMHLQNLKNKHKDERAFFIGNGPSLADTPLEQLEGEVTFATNKINKIFDETSWRPTYYTYFHGVNNFDRENFHESSNEAKYTFVSSDLKKYIRNNKNMAYLDVDKYKDHRIECLKNPELPERATEYWSDNLDKRIYFYNNSIYPVFQLVNYLGFSELYLLGCDIGIDTDWYPLFDDLEPMEFRYLYGDEFNSRISKYMVYFKKSNSRTKALINGVSYRRPSIFNFLFSNKSHFTEGYFDDVKIKRGTDAAQIRSHKLGRKKLNERGIEVFNLTPEGKLQVHPRQDINEVLNA